MDEATNRELVIAGFGERALSNQMRRSGNVAPGSTGPMRRKDRSGNDCHWILEVHLVDRTRNIGGFDEELLDLP